MSDYYTREAFPLVGTLDASGANTVVYAPGQPIDVKAAILVTTIAHTTADAIITVAVRDVDDGNSTTIGTFTVPFTGSAADDVKRVKMQLPSTSGSVSSIDGSTIYDADPGGFVEVNPGQEIAFTSNGGGDAGSYAIYLQVLEQGFSGSRVEAVDELTFTNA